MALLRYSFAVQLAFFITLLMQCVSGQSEAVLLVQERGKSAMEIWGQFAQIGGVSSVTGSGRLLLRNCTRSTRPIEDTQIKNEEWIGLIYLPIVEETIKEQTSSKPTKCSLLDQVRNAMLFGASALIILAMNPALLKELDVQQLFKQPIIVVQKPTSAAKIHGTVKGKSDVSIKISEGAKQQSHYWSTVQLTLWSTCGRSNGGTYREWEGVVCLGSGHGSTKIFSNLWTTLLSVAGTLYLLIMLHGKWITWGENEHHQDMESCLQRLAKASLSKMPLRKYKKKRYLLSRERESCAICLEEFIPGKMIRVLPCYHQFHCSCVDYWLISKRTCPLCKLNIIDQLTKVKQGHRSLTMTADSVGTILD